ncbi:uncharacterized protein LOC144225508 isoform X4 [Crocuta crocuta]
MLSLSLTCGYWENTWPLKSDRSRFESELAVSTLFDLGGKWECSPPLPQIMCVKFPTFGEIAGVSTSRMQWISLALGKPPS